MVWSFHGECLQQNILGQWIMSGVNIQCFGDCLCLHHQGSLCVVHTCSAGCYPNQFWWGKSRQSSWWWRYLRNVGYWLHIHRADRSKRNHCIQLLCDELITVTETWTLFVRPHLTSHTDPEQVWVLFLMFPMLILLVPTSLAECYVNWGYWWRLQRNQGRCETSFVVLVASVQWFCVAQLNECY
jgi:hypothetical protein